MLRYCVEILAGWAARILEVGNELMDRQVVKGSWKETSLCLH